MITKQGLNHEEIISLLDLIEETNQLQKEILISILTSKINKENEANNEETNKTKLLE